MKWLLGPVSLAVMNRIGRYLPYGVAVLARVGGRYEPYWPLFAVWCGCPGPYRWPVQAVLPVSCRMKWLFWPVSVAAMSRAVWSGYSGPYRWPL